MTSIRNPQKMGGSHPLAREWNAVVDHVDATRPILSRFGQDVASKHSPFVVVQVAGIFTNLIQCLETDFVTMSPVGNPLKVAMPFNLRTTITSRAGITYTYSDYSVAQERVADDGVSTETQVIVPSYEIGDFIIIAQTQNGTGISDLGVALTWLDINSSRAWAKKDGT